MAIIEFKQCSNEPKIIYRNADSKLVTLCWRYHRKILLEKLCRHDLMESIAACLQTHHRFALIYHCELDCKLYTLSMNYEDEIYLRVRCDQFLNCPMEYKMQIKYVRFYWSVIQAVGSFDFIDIGPLIIGPLNLYI